MGGKKMVLSEQGLKGGLVQARKSLGKTGLDVWWEYSSRRQRGQLFHNFVIEGHLRALATWPKGALGLTLVSFWIELGSSANGLRGASIERFPSGDRVVTYVADVLARQFAVGREVDP